MELIYSSILTFIKKIKWYLISSISILIIAYILILNVKIHSLNNKILDKEKALLECSNTVISKDYIINDINNTFENKMKDLEKDLTSRFSYKIRQLEAENAKLREALTVKLLDQDFSSAKKIKSIKSGPNEIEIYIKESGK